MQPTEMQIAEMAVRMKNRMLRMPAVSDATIHAQAKCDLEILFAMVPDYSIPALMRESYANAERHGFWDEEKEVTGTKFMLMVCELAEAFEEYRNNKPYTEIYYNATKPDKPEGIPIEMADTVIRIFDYCERHKIDLLSAIILKMNYNSMRPHLHGKKV